MGKEEKVPLNPLEVKDSKALILGLSELSVKQVILGIVQFFSFRVNLSTKQFLEILEDGRKYEEIIKKP